MSEPTRLENVLSRLSKVKKVGGRYYALCPAHIDKDRSLSIMMGTEIEGAILLHCYAGCSKDQVLATIGLETADLFPPSDRKGIVKEPEAIYSYTDGAGKDIYQVVRFPRKEFRQRHHSPGHPDAKADGWVWKLDGVKRVLYNLPSVEAAVASKRPVYLAEGEKDANTLIKLGLCATTNSGGAERWEESFTTILHGAHVIILPDNDIAGMKRVITCGNALLPVVRTLRVVWLPGLKAKGDVTDWVTSHKGCSASDLVAIVRSFPCLKPIQPDQQYARQRLAQAIAWMASWAQADWLSDTELKKKCAAILRDAFAGGGEV